MQGRQEVVKRAFFTSVKTGDRKPPSIAVAAEQVVVPRREVEQIAGRPALRFVIVIFCSRRRHLEVYGCQPSGIAAGKCWSRRPWSGKFAFAVGPVSKFRFAIRGKPRVPVHQAPLCPPDMCVLFTSPPYAAH